MSRRLSHDVGRGVDCRPAHTDQFADAQAMMIGEANRRRIEVVGLLDDVAVLTPPDAAKGAAGFSALVRCQVAPNFLFDGTLMPLRGVAVPYRRWLLDRGDTNNHSAVDLSASPA
jgi:hypothetical protein